MLLIIFVKHPILGQVKTRIAQTAGHEKAVSIYQQLLAYTRSITEKIAAEKWVWYGNEVPQSDLWSEVGYKRTLQQGDDLGERMKQAFEAGFTKGFEKIVLIGSDCADLNEEILTAAFQTLDEADVVLGPADDGGYYLIGMKRLWAEVFVGKTWSTEHVLEDTLNELKQLHASFSLLPVLSDIDYETDWEASHLS